MMNRAQLKACRERCVSGCELTALKDIRQISITHTNTSERLISFAKQVKNPYLFKVGDTAVKVEYGSGKSFGEAMVNLLSACG